MCTHGGDHPYVANWWPDAHIIGYEHGFTNQAYDILQVLAGEEPTVPIPDFDDAYQTQRVLEAALLSAEEAPAGEARRREIVMKTLVIGLGNPLITDDSVGLRVAAALKPLLANRPDVEVAEDYWGGLRLMERMIGFDGAVVIDAIQTGAPPGTIHQLTPEGIATQRSALRHRYEPRDRSGVWPSSRCSTANQRSHPACWH